MSADDVINEQPYANPTEGGSSVGLLIKHICSSLLYFLPEHLKDTILDVDDALVFTGIIALTLVSICVPYFFIEGYLSVRPLKKKVVELNKSLWKVSAAYETQQEEFEVFKQKAIAHDDFRKRAEQFENDAIILKKLEAKHKEQIANLKDELKIQMKDAANIKGLTEKTLKDKKDVENESEKYKAAYEETKENFCKSNEELVNLHTNAKSSHLQLGVSTKNLELLTAKLTLLQDESNEMKGQIKAENEKLKLAESEKQVALESKEVKEKELADFKTICHQYESTVSGLNDEIGNLESELTSLKDSLGEDSPLVEIAAMQATATFAEREANSLRTKLDDVTKESENLSSRLTQASKLLHETREHKETTNNRLQVLETYFKEREEDYMKSIEQLQSKSNVRDKGKEELIRIYEEKENIWKDLNERLATLNEEFEETKQQQRNDIRSLEAKSHENWLSLCQAERKAQDARKEAELYRQRLTAMTKEKDDEDVDGLNGQVPMLPLPHDLVPLPLLEQPSYFGLGDDFMPPLPLPDSEEPEPHRPPPLGGRLSPLPFSDMDTLSPIGIGHRDDECTDGSSGPDSPKHTSLREGWINGQHERNIGQGVENNVRLPRPAATSSPIHHGINL